MVLRTNFSSSRLVRLLGDASLVPAAPPRQDVAERLGQWLNVADAIALHATLQSMPSVAQAHRAGARAPVADAVTNNLVAEIQKVRATLVKSITRPDADGGPEYGPYHQRYLNQQRRMDLGVGALRAHARQVLAQVSPLLAQLAALDAAMGEMLGAREQQLLATVPAFLKKRFAQLQRQHASDAPASQGAQAVASTPAWLATFEDEFQATLLAELDARLLPVTGLQEALSQSHIH